MPMESSEFETLKPSKTPFNFPPHRRRPLKSKTFSTLVQIVSHCYNHSHALEAVPEEPKLDNCDTILGQVTGGDESLEHNHTESENLSVGKELLVDENREIMGSQAEGHVGDLHMEVDGLDHVNNINFADSLRDKEHNYSNDDVRLIDNHEDHIILPIFDVEEFGPLDGDVFAGSSKSSEDKRKESSHIEINEGDVQLKEKELEKLISSSHCSSADEEIEEGEISGDARVYGDLMDFLLEEDPVSALETQRVDKGQISKGIVDKEDSTADELQKKFEKDVGFTPFSVDAVDNLSENIEDELRESNINLVERENKVAALSLEDNAGGTKTKKRRRGPLTEEKKEKKKHKERKRRANKNRREGVNRLKLPPPVQKPKRVKVCRHYLEGRCNEGEKCNFSHDAIPKTKSKPCSHHAKGVCLKGDECPYDHQLSKYPCNNYLTKGSCIRGAACLFKHEKIPVKEGGPTASNISNPELMSVSSSPSNPIPKQQINGYDASHRNPNLKSNSIGISPCKTTQQNASVVISKPAAPAPKGISFLSNGYLSRGDRTVDNVAKTFNQMVHNALDSRNLDEVPISTPAAAPRGINFLSFGKALSNDSTKKPSIFDFNKDDQGNEKSPLSDYSVASKIPPVVAPQGIKSPSEDSTTNKKQANLISKEDNAVPVLPSSGKLGDNEQSTSTSSSFSEKVQLLSTSTPSSVHKALRSTLAFAAKMDKSAGASQSTKASTILDFLYGDRNNKSKQR